MKRLVLLLAVGLAGCAAGVPRVETRATLADIDDALGGRRATIVLLDSSRIVLRSVERVGPDSVAGVGEGRLRAAVALRDVAWLETPGVLGRSRRGTCLALASTPLACAVVGISGEAGSYFVPEDNRACALGTMAYTGACIGGALLATDPPLPIMIPITPLSQFPDAPRTGVGLR